MVTNSTHLYDQADFKSRDVVLTFHIGLMLRVEFGREREVPLAPESQELLPGSWRRWQQAFEAYEIAEEAEAFQSVGVRLRECLISFVGEARSDGLVPPARRHRRPPTSRGGRTCWRTASRPDHRRRPSARI